MGILDKIKSFFILSEDKAPTLSGFSFSDDLSETLKDKTIEALEDKNRTLSARVDILNLQNSNLKKEIQALQRKLGMVENLPSEQPKKRRRRKSKKPNNIDL